MITFPYEISGKDFEDLETGRVAIDDLIDESIPYAHLRSAGTCELAWDLADLDRARKKN